MRSIGLRERIVRLDLALFRRVARSHTPWLDRALPRLSHAADHSALWLATAIPLAALGGRRGQRAALRGLGSVWATSLIVNAVLKQLVRRTRPELRSVPAARRLHAQPLTTSFPSGHAASAAAFATGMSLELRRATPPLALAAAAVGYSRVYVGVHYPLDVAVGAATGVAVGVLSRFQWPVLPRQLERRRPTTAAVSLPPRPDGEGVTLIVNREAGSQLTAPGVEELRERLPRARVVEVEEPQGLAELLRAEAARCAVLGICGGDGSTAVAVEAATEHDRPLLLIPAGTLNHLGRDIRVESADDALAALAAGEAVAIDLGEIDGRPFLNTASFGAYTTMLETRAALQKRIGRWPAHFAAVALALLRSRPLEVSIDGRRRRAWMVFVGNCRHEPAGFAPAWRPRLDDGLLDVRVLSGEHPLARVRLLLSILAGRLTRSVAYDQRAVTLLTVETDRDSLPLARDGDSFRGSGSFAVRKLPRRLVVHAPAVEDAARTPSRQ